MHSLTHTQKINDMDRKFTLYDHKRKIMCLQECEVEPVERQSQNKQNCTCILVEFENRVFITNFTHSYKKFRNVNHPMLAEYNSLHLIVRH
jgi:hypothetical protein